MPIDYKSLKALLYVVVCVPVGIYKIVIIIGSKSYRRNNENSNTRERRKISSYNLMKVLLENGGPTSTNSETDGGIVAITTDDLIKVAIKRKDMDMIKLLRKHGALRNNLDHLYCDIVLYTIKSYFEDAKNNNYNSDVNLKILDMVLDDRNNLDKISKDIINYVNIYDTTKNYKLKVMEILKGKKYHCINGNK